MNLARLEEFVAIVEAGSIRAAARKLGVSQPALTKGVRQLEREFGVKLLQRTPTGVLPNQFGRSLVARARSIRGEVRKAREEIEQIGGSRGGSVAFGIGAVSAPIIVPAAMERFRADHPEVRISIMEGLPHMLVPLVRDETLDFAIGGRLSGQLDPALRFTPLVHSPRAVVARRGHPLAGASSVDELLDAEWLSLPALSAMAVRPQPGWMGRLKQVVDCDSYVVAAALLAGSDMIGLISRRLLDERFVGSSLVEIHVREPLPLFSVGLYQRADAPLTPVAERASAALGQAARETMGAAKDA